MKKFFTKIKDWFVRHKPSKRRLIQVYAALLYNANIKGFIKGNIYTGNTKYACVPGFNCYSCPGAIGSCPLGALQNALQASGTRAPFYVLGIIVLFGILLGRTICGFLCPVGLAQELLYKIKTPKLKKNRVTHVLSYFKYVLLLVLVIILPILLGSPTFCKYICPAGTFGGAVNLLAHPNNGNLYVMLSGLFTWKFALLIAIIILSIFIFRFFCRFLCPLGALYGFFNKISLLGVKLDKNKCTDCGLCISHCKMDIGHVGDHECIECGECIAVCPTQAITWKGSKIFLHPNAIEAKAEPQPDIGAILNSGTTVSSSELTVQTAHTLSQSKAQEEEVLSTATPPIESPAVAKMKRRNKILEAVAWSVACVFLAIVLIYYNFIAKDRTVFVYNVGDMCPQFSVQLYDTAADDDDKFEITDSRGKVTVLNFWATWCNPCVAEIPHFNELQKNYPEDVVVVALHQISPEEDVQQFINIKGWNDYVMRFAQDDTVLGMNESAVELFPSLGGTSYWPMTVVLDRDGKIAYNRQGSMNYEELERVVKGFI